MNHELMVYFKRHTFITRYSQDGLLFFNHKCIRIWIQLYKELAQSTKDHLFEAKKDQTCTHWVYILETDFVQNVNRMYFNTSSISP